MLDIEAGAHFTVAIVMNVSGDGCTLDGLKTGHKCVVINPDNGLTEQVLTSPPPPRTKWTRRVPHPVLIGHAAY